MGIGEDFLFYAYEYDSLLQKSQSSAFGVDFYLLFNFSKTFSDRIFATAFNAPAPWPFAKVLDDII